jgi:hypothetical protein
MLKFVINFVIVCIWGLYDKQQTNEVHISGGH